MNKLTPNHFWAQMTPRLKSLLETAPGILSKCQSKFDTRSCSLDVSLNLWVKQFRVTLDETELAGSRFYQSGTLIGHVREIHTSPKSESEQNEELRTEKLLSASTLNDHSTRFCAPRIKEACLPLLELPPCDVTGHNSACRW